MGDNNLGFYIHVPFCKSKCPYCDFYSLTNIQNIQNYVDAVLSEIEKWGKKIDKAVDTIYFGGGTPSLLSADNIVGILGAIRNNFRVIDPEITLEVNPADFKFLDFEKLKFCGVNRISIGAQSLDDSQLKVLGRRHNAAEIFEAVDFIKKSGMDNISLDIILGTPNQNLEHIEEFVNYCGLSGIPHISAYMLKIEPNTPYYFNKDNFNFFSDDRLADIYLYTCKLMKKLGYDHYEISNFAKKGFESRHNLKYWNLDEYLGIGPSAHSFLGGKRFYYPKDLAEFIAKPKITNEEKLDSEKELVMLGLRTKNGITNEVFQNKLGYDIPASYFDKIKKFQKYGLVNSEEGRISLTESGFLLSNYIISEIL